MDKATRRLRQRIKAERTPRNTLSNFEPRGLGRRDKSHATFPSTICQHVEGGRKVPIRKRRKRTNETYTLMVLVGGVRCPNQAQITKADGTKVCPLHVERPNPE